MRLTARGICAVVLTVAWFCPAAPLYAQLDLGGGGGGGGGDLNLPVDPGNLPGDVGGLGGLGGVDRGNPVPDAGVRLPQTPSIAVVDHAAAVKAVQDHRALPLNDILASAAKNYGGKVIDVQLVRSGDKLLYQVKLLDRGIVSLAYFDAASARPAMPPR